MTSENALIEISIEKGMKMQMHRLDHVNVKTSRLPEMIAFYEGILGMKNGTRPPFPFPGAWLYIGDYAVVHLVEVDQECASVDPKIEHYAFQASGLNELTTRLTKANIAFTVDPVPGIDVVQVNVEDVDGNHIHIDFNSAELRDSSS